MRTQSITLNFLPITASFAATCYERKLNVPNEKRPFPDAYLSVWQKKDGSSIRSWLSMKYRDGYVPCRIMSDVRPNVATWVLRQYAAPLLANYLKTKGCRAEIRHGLFSTIDVRVKEFKEGWQGFKCEFTWIPSLRQHGLLVRYHFFRSPDCNNTIASQKLSLSLNQYGSPNKDFYADVRGLLESFRTKFLVDFRFAMSQSGVQLGFADFAEVEARNLGSRTYEFGANKSGQKPYFGIRSFGPYREIQKMPTFVFVFREQDRQLARFLYSSLIGKEYAEEFPGMTQYFKVHFSNVNVRHVIILDHTWQEYERVVSTVKKEGWDSPVCIVLTPGNPSEYYLQKSIFLNNEIPSQDVRIDHIAQKNNFQWSIAGLALQLFCKAGGIPWCVQTKQKHSLIIGISQLWDDAQVGHRRHVAYSVMTDASGMFKEIRTLANSNNSDDYISDLATRLRTQLIEWNGKERPERIVLHCSFRLKKMAMNAIRQVVHELQSDDKWLPRIVILRVDVRHPYFGFDGARGSCVPIENTYIQLGQRRFVLWTDGAIESAPMRSRPTYPLYVCIDRADGDLSGQDERELLEDLGNLAGANWRGFNAKAKPASVNYCQIVGDFIHELTSYEKIYHKLGYAFQMPKLELLTPWFL